MAGDMAHTAFSDQVLHEAGWLARLPADFRAAWMARATPFSVPRGEMIYRDGDEVRCLYGLISGAMAITIGPPRLAPRLINIMHPGTWFGVGPLLREGGRKMEFRAAEPSRRPRTAARSCGCTEGNSPSEAASVDSLARSGSASARDATSASIAGA